MICIITFIDVSTTTLSLSNECCNMSVDAILCSMTHSINQSITCLPRLFTQETYITVWSIYLSVRCAIIAIQYYQFDKRRFKPFCVANMKNSLMKCRSNITCLIYYFLYLSMVFFLQLFLPILWLYCHNSVPWKFSIFCCDLCSINLWVVFPTLFLSVDLYFSLIFIFRSFHSFDLLFL